MWKLEGFIVIHQTTFLGLWGRRAESEAETSVMSAFTARSHSRSLLFVSWPPALPQQRELFTERVPDMEALGLHLCSVQT